MAMRLAHLTPYTDPVVGGISSYVRELSAAYQSMGIEQLGLSVVGKTNRTFRVLGPRKIAFLVRATYKLLRWKPDVIHSHAHWHVLLPGIIVKLLRPSARVLFTFHTEPASEGGVVRSALLRALLNFCDGVAFVSRALRNSMNLPGSIPQGVVYAAAEQHRPSPRSSEDGRRPEIVFVGPLVWPRKVAGVLLLLDAFAMITSAFREWRLIIIGDGPLIAQVSEKVIRLGLTRVVELTGLLADATSEIAAAGLYAQISFQEGLPLSVLNAMAAGTPVIATAVGGMPEVIASGQTGLLVEASKEAVAGGLATLMSSREFRHRLGTAAQDWVRTELSWEKVASRHLQLVSKGIA